MNTKLIKSQDIKGVSVSETGQMLLFKLSKNDITGRKQLPVIEFDNVTQLSEFIAQLNDVKAAVVKNSSEFGIEFVDEVHTEQS